MLFKHVIWNHCAVSDMLCSCHWLLYFVLIHRRIKVAIPYPTIVQIQAVALENKAIEVWRITRIRKVAAGPHKTPESRQQHDVSHRRITVYASIAQTSPKHACVKGCYCLATATCRLYTRQWSVWFQDVACRNKYACPEDRQFGNVQTALCHLASDVLEGCANTCIHGTWNELHCESIMWHTNVHQCRKACKVLNCTKRAWWLTTCCQPANPWESCQACMQRLASRLQS